MEKCAQPRKIVP